MSTPLIEARRVTKILSGVVPVTLVRDINLTIMPREFIAITGPSGSGKSSLLYLLGLLDLPTDGDVLIDGRSTTTMTETERAKVRLARLGFVFQFHFLLPAFSIRLAGKRFSELVSLSRHHQHACQCLECEGAPPEAYAVLFEFGERHVSGDITISRHREHIARCLMPPVAHEGTVRKADQLPAGESVIDGNDQTRLQAFIDPVEPLQPLRLHFE